MNAPTSSGKSFKRFSMHMSNGTPELCDSWNLLGKLVSHEVVHAPCGCTLVLVPKARTQVLVVESMGLEKPHPTVASHTSLSIFNLVSPHQYISNSYHTRSTAPSITRFGLCALLELISVSCLAMHSYQCWFILMKDHSRI